MQVGDTILASSWDGSQTIVGLDGVTLPWGRETIYDQVAATVATIRVLDPTGFWATANDLNGQLVLVTRSSPARTMFRGRVAELSSQLTVVLNPATRKNQFVWIVTLTVPDIIAALAQTRPVWPTTLVADNGKTPGYFNETCVVPGTYEHALTTPSRIEQLQQAGLLAFVTSADNPNPMTFYGSATVPYIDYVWLEDNPSFLSMLADLYGLLPLGHVNYKPSTDSIIIGLPAISAGMSLTYTGGHLVLAPVSGLSIDAGQVIIPAEGPTIESRIQAAVDLVRSHWTNVPNSATLIGYFAVTTDVQVDTPTDRDTGSNTSRVLDIGGTWKGYELVTAGFAFYQPNAIEYAGDLSAGTKSLVDDINGQFTSPDLTFDFRRFAPGDAIADVLLACYDKPTPLYFAGSILNYLANYGPQFQLIGGTITWHGALAGNDLPAGWTVDMKLAPTGSSADNVSITALVTNTTPAFQDYDPLITLADLGDVTVGAA